MRADADPGTQKSSVHRTLAAIKVTGHAPRQTQPMYTEQDVLAAVRVMNEKWDRQTWRLQQYLIRNYNIANGLPFTPDELDENVRPPTPKSPSGPKDRISLMRSTTSESSLSEEMSAKFGLSIEPDDKQEKRTSGVDSEEMSPLQPHVTV
jgi:hypothetical protein